MTLLGFALWLAIPFGGPAAGPVDIGATVLIESRIPHGRPFTLPHVVVVYPQATPGRAATIVRHVEHWDAFGPGFLVAYAAGLGRGFEDYLGDDIMWRPPPELQRRCPLLRVPPRAPAQFMPCWRW